MKQRPYIAILLSAFSLIFAGQLKAKQIEVVAETNVPADLVETEEEDSPPAWRYLLHLPRDYVESEKEWPFIFYLHGRSLRGDKLEKVKRYGLPSRLDRRPEFPFVEDPSLWGTLELVNTSDA